MSALKCSVEVEMYDLTVELYTDKAEYIGAYKERYGEDIPESELDCYGLTNGNHINRLKYVMIFINLDVMREQSVAGPLGTLAHELFHTVTFTCLNIGFKPTEEDEPMAYFIGHLMRKFSTHIIAEYDRLYHTNGKRRKNVD